MVPRSSVLLLLALLLGCNTAELIGPTPQDDAGDPDALIPNDAGVEGTSAVKIVVEPSDNGAAIQQAIQGAKTSVHMTMYLLSTPGVINALIAQKKAGHDVKVVLNQTFPDPSFDNTPEFTQLKNAGVQVAWAPAAFNFTHEKCVIIDGTTAWIMTMNLTASSAQNREFLAIDSDPDDVSEAEAIFQGDFTGQVPTLVGKLLVAPVNARDKLGKLVNEATKTLDVEGENFSDDALQADLIQAKARGVAVRIVVSDQTPSTAMGYAIAAFKKAGIPIVKLANPYVHSKALVADGTLAYVGSANFTANSLDSNRELGLLVGAPSEVALVASTIDQDFKAGVSF
jgi:phosphatidylserine/phosphatidylglycerophosphate/cardiolipin synthase-like enzyme